jgi:hypothetical protein
MKRPSDAITSCADSNCEWLISPIPRPSVQELRVSLRPHHRRVVLVDSRKPNSLVVLRQVAGLLRDRQIAVKPEIHVKDDTTRAMDGALLDAIAREQGLIVCGIAD